MTHTFKTLFSTVALATLLAPSAIAQQGSQNAIDQVQLGDVWAHINVHVPTAQENVVATSLATANTATAIKDSGPLQAVINQSADGNIRADAFVWSGDVHGNIASSVNATGNAATAANWHGSTHAAITQDQWGAVKATSFVDNDYGATSIAANTTAAANVALIESDGPNVGAFVDQNAMSDVTSVSRVTSKDTVEEWVQNVAVAAGNSADILISDSQAHIGTIQTTSEHTSINSFARTSVEATPEVTTAAASVGNQLNISAVNSTAAIGFPDSEAFQGNGSDVHARADVHVGYTHAVNATASGVGNAIAFSGLDTRTDLNTIQSNTGNISSSVNVNVADLGGGIGVASATSIGNSFSAIDVGGHVRGDVFQQSFGNISSNTSIRTGGQAGTIAGTAVAIGNSATIQNSSNNNGRP